MSNFKKRALEAIIAATLITTPIKAQNVVTIQSQNVPSLKNSDAKIVLDNGSQRYWGITDSTGKVIFNIPNGTYNMMIESNGTYKIFGQRTINGNTEIQTQPMEKKVLDSPYYPDNLHFFKLMNGAEDTDPNHNTHQTNPSPIRFFNDPTNMPSYATGVQDSILFRLIRKTNNATKFIIATTDSTGIRTKYVHSSGMPPGYSGDAGATDPDAGNQYGYTDVTVYMNMDVARNQDAAYGTLSRETGRMLGIQALSQDPNMVMSGNAIGGGNTEFTNDEYWLIETSYKIKPLTLMLEYIDSVVVSYNLENPSKPSLVYPANHAVDVPTNTTFRWNKINYQGITSYDFQLVSDTTTLADLIEKTTTDSTAQVDSLPNNVKRYWRTTAINPAGQTSSQWNDIITSLTGVEDMPTGPNKFRLYQNYPNPFNGTTNIEYDIEKTGHVKLEIFNVLGQEVATITDTKLQPGHYKTQWNTNNLPSGAYFYKLQTENNITIKKMLLMK